MASRRSSWLDWNFLSASGRKVLWRASCYECPFVWHPEAHLCPIRNFWPRRAKARGLSLDGESCIDVGTIRVATQRRFASVLSYDVRRHFAWFWRRRWHDRRSDASCRFSGVVPHAFRIFFAWFGILHRRRDDSCRDTGCRVVSVVPWRQFGIGYIGSGFRLE